MENCHDPFYYRYVPTYGNWGGPGWKAGERYGSNTSFTYPAEDSLDEVFRNHDYEYSMSMDSCGKILSHDGIVEADFNLVMSLKRLDRDPNKWENPPASYWYARLYRWGALYVFIKRLEAYNLFLSIDK